jgi:predicted aspartyl protease
MPPRVLLPASFVLGFLLLSAARGDDSGYVRINLTRRLENHMLAPVQLNGRKANFIVDTGAAYSCLDLRKAGSFGLQPKNGVAVTLNGRKHITTQIDVTSIGPVEIRNLKMVLIDFSEFERRRGSGEIQADGILGLDVLRLGRAVLDCQQLRLFWKAVPGAPNVMASTLRGAGWTAVKLQLKDNLYFANGILNETPTRFVVDTGAFADARGSQFCRARRVKTKWPAPANTGPPQRGHAKPRRVSHGHRDWWFCPEGFSCRHQRAAQARPSGQLGGRPHWK